MHIPLWQKITGLQQTCLVRLAELMRIMKANRCSNCVIRSYKLQILCLFRCIAFLYLPSLFVLVISEPFGFEPSLVDASIRYPGAVSVQYFQDQTTRANTHLPVHTWICRVIYRQRWTNRPMEYGLKTRRFVGFICKTFKYNIGYTEKKYWSLSPQGPWNLPFSELGYLTVSFSCCLTLTLCIAGPDSLYSHSWFL